MTRLDFQLRKEAEAVQPRLSNLRDVDQQGLSLHRSVVLTFAKMFMTLASQAQEDSKDRVLMSGMLMGTCCSEDMRALQDWPGIPQ